MLWLLRLDIDSMMHWGAIQPGFHLGGEMRLHQLYGGDIAVKFESRDPWRPAQSSMRRAAAVAASVASGGGGFGDLSGSMGQFNYSITSSTRASSVGGAFSIVLRAAARRRTDHTST